MIEGSHAASGPRSPSESSDGHEEYVPVDAQVTEEDGAERVGVSVPREAPVTLILNGEEFVTLLASPGSPRSLAAGFLFNEGIIDEVGQITSLEEDDTGIRVDAGGVEVGRSLFERRVFGSGCGKAVGFTSALDALAAARRTLPEERPWVGAGALRRAAATAYTRGPLYKRTRGTHSASLYDRQGELVAMEEDIGRHNAVDKVIGCRLLQGLPLDGLFMAITGRISSEMVTKVAHTPIPLLISKSVPTDLALVYAEKVALGVVGRAGSKRFTVYSFPELVDPEA